MDIQADIDKQIHVSKWIDGNLSTSYSCENERDRWALTCFDIAIEHHAGIVALVQANLFGSAMALLRVELEALVRGLWLKYVASDKQLKNFKRDKTKKGFGDMISEVEEQRGIESGVLSYIKTEQWSIFNSFTHTGSEALIRRMGAQSTGYDNYDPEDAVKVLKFSGIFALFASIELAVLTRDQATIKRAVEFARDYEN